MRTGHHTLPLALAVMAVATPLHAAAEAVDFARDILPVLSEKCFVCHGPDTRKKNALRLDSFESATSDRGGYRAIDPAAPEKSEILTRIHDTEDPMPPKDSEKKLTAKERDLLSRWVRQGGHYAKHWAFVTPRKSPPPTHAGVESSGVVDAFILAGLQKKEIPFAPEAERSVLARRAALVLTGLPPEPEQLSAFLMDLNPGAYERLVDQFLASPRFGEHQARYWLDAVRYGDTHGLHLDNRRGIYPYRDWVVQAFNDDLPLDDFIRWQLAGDLLPSPTLAQRVATGFVRMNPTTAEGGVLPEEFQAKNNFDRIETLGTVFLGASLNCARCHTHKYDPIPQTEYYRLLAFFNSTAEHSLDGNSYTYGPILKAPKNQTAWRDWNALESERSALLAKARLETENETATLVAYAEQRAGWIANDWRLTQAVALDAPAPAEKDWEEAKDLPGVSKKKLPKEDQAIWVSFTAEMPVDQVLWLTCSGGPGSHVWVDDLADSAPGDQPLALALSKGSHQVRIKMVGTESELEVRVHDPWKRVAQAKDWSECTPEDRLLILAEPSGPFAYLQSQELALDLTRRIAFAQSDFTSTLVAQELSEPRETRLLRRGEYDLPQGDPLEPGILTVMGRFPEGAPRNRLGLARWLTAPEHPLVSRVLINQIWQHVFGEGLVRTPEDFGLQGQQPTHPMLLDWLAVELQESGWNMKHMLRLMVTSRTFRQNSAWRTDVDDPENRLLARGPRYRLDAEVLRDIGLWASGLLDPEMGGEGVKPYQPDGLWFAMAHPASNTKRYVRDHGQLIYRRSLYVYWKRTSPHPMMTLFDAPSREASCVRRSRTTTSLQSLGLLNETQRVEMSRMLAERLLKEHSNDSQRLDALFKLMACRPPTDSERDACQGLLQTLRARYTEAEQDALELLATGDAPRDQTLAPAEHAAWSQVAITVLASDIAILLY